MNTTQVIFAIWMFSAAINFALIMATKPRQPKVVDGMGKGIYNKMPTNPLYSPWAIGVFVVLSPICLGVLIYKFIAELIKERKEKKEEVSNEKVE